MKRGESVASILINSYQPTIITDKRRKIEDLCRDLVVNNDHIHVVEQRMRAAIEQVHRTNFHFFCLAELKMDRNGIVGMNGRIFLLGEP